MQYGAGANHLVNLSNNIMDSIGDFLIKCMHFKKLLHIYYKKEAMIEATIC